MGLFDFLKSKRTPPPQADEPPAPKKPRRSLPSPSEKATAKDPKGRITVYSASATPKVERSIGGVILVNFGSAGDDHDRELDASFRAIGPLLDAGEPDVRSLRCDGDVDIDVLLASDPDTEPLHAPVFWIFGERCVEAFVDDPRRLQAFLRVVFDFGRRDEPLVQAVVIVDEPTPAILAFVRLVRGLGVPVIRPDPRHAKPVVLIESPDAENMISLFAGGDYPSNDPADPYACSMNEEKAREKNAAALEAVEAKELAGLVQRTSPARGQPIALLRSPRLQGVLLDAEQNGLDTKALLGELLERRAPLFLTHDKSASGFPIGEFGAAGSALRAYVDTKALAWAAEDLAMTPGSFSVAAIPVPALLRMAVEGKLGIALFTYKTREFPVYAVVPVTLAQALVNAQNGTSDGGEA